MRGEIMEKKKEITAIYTKDSNRYHRDLIDEGQGIAGNQWIFQSIV
jgi:hypothetical protein